MGRGTPANSVGTPSLTCRYWLHYTVAVWSGRIKEREYKRGTNSCTDIKGNSIERWQKRRGRIFPIVFHMDFSFGRAEKKKKKKNSLSPFFLYISMQREAKVWLLYQLKDDWESGMRERGARKPSKKRK